MADTWAEALRDPHCRIRWLFQLGTDGAILRASDAATNLNGHHWRGILAVTRLPSRSVDVFNGSAPAQTMAVSIAPDCDDPGSATPWVPSDYADRYGTTFLGTPFTCWLWAEGTPWSERQPVTEGNVTDALVSESGALVLELADYSRKYDVDLPTVEITKALWPSSYADDRGMRYPIRIGAYTRAEVPVLDTSSKYGCVAGHALPNVSNLYLEDTSETIAAQTDATDTDGNTFHRVTTTNAIGDKTITASGNGHVDDADGRYSGTASGAVTHPADALFLLAELFAGVPAAKVNVGSFRGLRAELPGWIGSIQIEADEIVSFFAVAEDAGVLMRAALFVERSLLTVRRLDFNRGPVLSLRMGENVTGRGDVSHLLTLDDLVTRIRIRYNWGWKRRVKRLRFRSSYRLGPADYAPFSRNLARRGWVHNEIRMRTKVFADDDTVEAAAGALAELHGKVRRGVRVAVDRTAHALNLLDVVEYTDATYPSSDGNGCTDKRFVVVGIETATEALNLDLMEC